MTAAEALAAIRLAIGEPTPQLVLDSAITTLINRAVVLIWNIMRQNEPAISIARTSLSSYTNIFALPSDVQSIMSVFDMGTSAKTITGATKASPIVITSAAHGFDDGDLVLVHDVGGNTAANGLFQVYLSATNTFALLGSAGTIDYTSGGKVFKEMSSFTRMSKISPADAAGQNIWSWYLRGRYIVVDDLTFGNDLVVDYLKSSTPTIADIPPEYHDGIVSFAALNLLDQESSFAGTISFHQAIWADVLGSLRSTLNLDMDATPMPMGISWPDLHDL